MVKFRWRSGSQIRIQIATLVRRALAEVCTVSVLLVHYYMHTYTKIFVVCKFWFVVLTTGSWLQWAWSSMVYGIITFRVSHRRCEMYCGHVCLCVCLSVCLSTAACPHYCMDPDVIWGSGRGCPLVVQIRFTILALYKLVCMYVHYWVDLQLVHGLCCYGNISWTVVTSLPSSLI